MLISEWGSDVCSSDLDVIAYLVWGSQLGAHRDAHLVGVAGRGGRHYPANAFHSTRNARKSGNDSDALHYAQSHIRSYASESHNRSVTMRILVLGDRKSTRLNYSH